MDRKFASDFTEYHYKNIRKDLTLIDVDACQYRKMKDGKERIRFIEYKHMNERHGHMQMEVLKRFKHYFNALNKIASKTKFELFMITADFKKNHFNKDFILENNHAVVFNFMEKTTKIINENNLISFLNFNKEFKELEEKIGKKIYGIN